MPKGQQKFDSYGKSPFGRQTDRVAKSAAGMATDESRPALLERGITLTVGLGLGSPEKTVARRRPNPSAALSGSQWNAPGFAGG